MKLELNITDEEIVNYVDAISDIFIKNNLSFDTCILIISGLIYNGYNIIKERSKIEAEIFKHDMIKTITNIK